MTLVGIGGVGKTRLAEQVAAVMADRFDDGVAVCALDAVRDPDSVHAALIDALEAQHEGDRTEVDTLVAALGTRRILLVLDNCEHVLTVVSQLVERILDRCANVAVLATSREHLHVPRERVWQVAPLAVPAAGASAGEVMDTPAGALFCARAEAVEPTFALSDGNAPAVGELCLRLDGIPLAIELAAARVRAMTPADLVERFDQRFRLLTAGPRRDEGRHRTLHRVVAWSYELLGEAEARRFDRLSVFAGSFSLSAAEQVCAGDPIDGEDVAGVLADLIDKSMVVGRVDGRVRYRCAHAAHHVAVAEALGPRVRGADEGPVLAEIDAVVDDLRAAHAWLIATIRAASASADRAGEAFRTGEGVGWHEHDPHLLRGIDRLNGPMYRHQLVQQWIPALDGVHERLTAGARVAGIGCATAPRPSSWPRRTPRHASSASTRTPIRSPPRRTLPPRPASATGSITSR